MPWSRGVALKVVVVAVVVVVVVSGDDGGGREGSLISSLYHSALRI